MINEKRLIDTLSELIRIDSSSLHERAMCDEVLDRLRGLGIDAKEDDTAQAVGGEAGNIVAMMPGNADLPSVLLSAHMDTVPPCQSKKAISNGKTITSDGNTVLGADDAAGIAIILEVIRTIAEKHLRHGDIKLLFTVGEEVGLVGSRHLKKGEISADYGYVLDDHGPAGGIICHAPAHNRIEVAIHGKSVHAGVEPEKGISAIGILADAVSNMKLGRIDHETTANIGIVKGGQAMNIVCGSAEVVGEARSRSLEKLAEQTRHMEECFRNAATKYGGSIDFVAELLYHPVDLDRKHPVVEKARVAAQKCGIELEYKSSGGGSDTNVLNGLGIPATTLSVGYEKMHTKEEYIDINEFIKAAELALAIVVE